MEQCVFKIVNVSLSFPYKFMWFTNSWRGILWNSSSGRARESNTWENCKNLLSLWTSYIFACWRMLNIMCSSDVVLLFQRVGSMIFFETFGYSTVKFVSNLLEKYLSKSSTSSNSVAGHMQIDIQPKNKDWSSFLETGNELLQVFKHYLPFFIQLHLALFYFQGTFYHFSKRVLGIHYVSQTKCHP